MPEVYQSVLERQKQEKLYRKLAVVDESLLDFTSFDYLSLAKHPLLKKNAEKYLHLYGVGSSGSRLTTGTKGYTVSIESKVAKLKGKEAALVMNSGYQANLSVIACLAGRNSVVYADGLCHNSLLMGAKLSEAKLVRFPHKDYRRLETLLQGEKKQAIVLTESLFGMDGDFADLDCLINLCTEYGALLYVDEAHATGIYGKKGAGLTEGKEGIDVVMGTFGKALGSFGAYIACSEEMKEYLVNFCGGLIYSTALPPPVMGAQEAALDLLPELEKERGELLTKALWTREKLLEEGWNTGKTTSQIIPIIIGGGEKALAIGEHLKNEGIHLHPIRPPTVPKGTARLRLSLCLHHTEKQIEQLINALRKFL